jgi:hypothetical protein
MKTVLVLLAITSCAHASPVSLATDAASSAIAAAINAPTRVESEKAAEKFVDAVTPKPGKKVNAGEVVGDGLEAGKNLLKEGAKNAPKMAEDVATHPGPIGWLLAVKTGILGSPTAQWILLGIALVVVGIILRRVMKPKDAANAANFAEDVGMPLAKLTPTALDDYAVRKLWETFRGIAEKDPAAKELLHQVHDEAEVPVEVAR